ncbi:outer membrane beta-barrel protein [Flavobacterium sp. DG1-102-2]|uniref:outer membrane beta-barrel protein n=1 Tax=Flavobacterium sp. DG1-102-2 TaxID=3081663 RepID=UPI002949A744|nr:outer membrane beta-barrel protein [Flavobacterium sp. DG1-102-2]MDV6168852.1 outer membrane beta-barrel protein [Flavobacterium sp. DG1-102-2]
MEVKKDIGKAFREKLDSLDRQPGDALWDSISKDLDTKKKRKFPLFWFSIFSLLATVCMVLIVTYFSNDNNAAEINQDNRKHDDPAYSPVATGIERPPVNKREIINSSTNSSSNRHKINATVTKAGTSKDSINSNSLKNKKSTKTYGQAAGAKSSSSKNSRNKNNAGNQTGRGQITKYLDRSALTENTKTPETGNKSKKHPTTSYASKTKTFVASGKRNTKSGNPTKNTLYNKQLAEEQQEIVSGRPVNIRSQSSNTTAGTTEAALDNQGAASEITPNRQIKGIANDGVTDSVTVVADSLKTESLKEVKEEKKDENKKDSLAPVIVKRFSVFAYGGPSFFNFPDRKIVTDSTTSNINTNSTARFGVLLGYRINHKLSIRTGLSVYKLKQSAGNIKLNYVMGGDAVNPGLIPTADFDWIDYKQPFGTNSGQIISNLGDNYQAIINIDRDLNYLEIPLEIGYDLSDRKFGINIFGGGTMLLMTKNEVIAYNEKGAMHLGKWNEAAKTSFTGTLGLGLHYNLSPTLQLNAEPVLNYYFNTYKDSKPYAFTIRLGLQYNFDIWLNKK